MDNKKEDAPPKETSVDHKVEDIELEEFARAVDEGLFADDEAAKVQEPLLEPTPEVPAGEGDADTIEMQPLNTDGTATAEVTTPAETEQRRPKGLRGYLNSHAGGRYKKYMIAIAILAGILLFLVFLRYSIVSVQYDQLALSRSLITGRLNANHTYKNGLHFLMPWNELIFFDRQAHSVQYKSLRVLTRDKLEVFLSLKVYYFLNPDELGQLYRKFATNYQYLIERVARSLVLNEGQQFTIQDYRANRQKVYKALKLALKEKLHSYHLNLLDVYVQGINFARQINDLNLQRVLNDIYNEKAVYTKQRELTVAETAVQVNRKRNEARTIVSNATFSAKNSVKAADIDYGYKMELIHVDNFNRTLYELNFRNPANRKSVKHCMSYIYLYSLVHQKNLHVYPIDYTQKYLFANKA